MNLIEFLLARIAEDEAEARDAIRERDRVKFIHPPQVPDMSLQSWPDAPVPTVLVGPERVLAECEAKRQVVALHEPHLAEFDSGDRFTRGWECVICGGFWPDIQHVACPTLLSIAAIWRDHADYRQEWKP